MKKQLVDMCYSTCDGFGKQNFIKHHWKVLLAVNNVIHQKP